MSSFLEFQGITKTFPGVKALDNVSFGVTKGTVHGLVGENGAGKSTLLKILSGAYTPTDGKIVIHQKPKVFTRTRDAIDAGVAIIYQELNLVPEMTVAENLLLGQWPQRGLFLDRKKLLERSRTQITELLEDIDPDTRLKLLPIGQRQMVEIGKALLHNAEVIAFDEPTSSLSRKETEQLFRIIRNLRAQGKTILYVSHRLEEIFTLCDAVTVFRDGRRIQTFESMEDVTDNTLIQRMVGREIKDMYGYRPRKKGATLFAVTGLQGPGIREKSSFSAARGEIVGFFGLSGSGRTELMKNIFGAIEKRCGEIQVNGKPIAVNNPFSAINQGLCLCPEDRKYEGIIAVRSLSENINISSRRHFLNLGLFLNKRREQERADSYIEKLHIRTTSRDQFIGNLSGGNQQKAILARWLSEKVDVFLLDEPTRGIDVGSKYEIYQIMYGLAEEGKTVIFASSSLPEVMGVADRVVVMCGGTIVGEVDRKDVSEETLLSMALPKG
ncbi:MAG TPA: L-arabinose ABC transporter ATP-binding protein AraG [Syntrophales bacterium]|jgi:L-arabinose transport system ATP-binding protein|nr:L-arabinose ABC transporter ATP-binding protein AraG [Syntrophales bacterium]